MKKWNFFLTPLRQKPEMILRKYWKFFNEKQILGIFHIQRDMNHHDIECSIIFRY